MNKKTIFLILIVSINIYECKMKEETLGFFNVMKEQYDKITYNMNFVGNGEKSRKKFDFRYKKCYIQYYVS
jgi:hypothetical protein